MKPTIYIETTIPSHYYNQRTAPDMVALSQWTREWWDLRRHDYNLVTSAAVIEELTRGDHPQKKEKLSLLDGVTLLPITEEIIDVARVYIARKAMPDDPKGDALHLAFASVYKCDMLLSWNCRHIVNHLKTGHLRQLNSEMNLPMPALITPFELLNREVSDE